MADYLAHFFGNNGNFLGEKMYFGYTKADAFSLAKSYGAKIGAYQMRFGKMVGTRIAMSDAHTYHRAYPWGKRWFKDY